MYGHRRLRRLYWDLEPLDEAAWGDVLARVRQTLGGSRLPPICVSRVAPMPLLVRPRRPVVILPASLVSPGERAASSSTDLGGQGGSHDLLYDALVHECRTCCGTICG